MTVRPAKPLRCLISSLNKLFLLSMLAIFSAAGASASVSDSTTNFIPLKVLIVELSGLDFRSHNFNVGFFVWYESQIDKPNYLNRLRVLNAKTVEISDREQFATEDGVVYRRFVRAEINHLWDLQHFPFDTHSLVIGLGIDGFTYDELRFVGDSTTSIINDDLHLPDWDILGANLFATRTIISSALGDPQKRDTNETIKSRADITLTISRATRSGFLQLISATMAAALLALMGLFIPLREPGPRFGLIAAGVFTNVISMRNTSIDLNAASQITLTHEIHMLVMGFIAVSAVTSIWCVVQEYVQNRGESAYRFSRHVAISCSVLLCVLLAGLLIDGADFSFH